MVVVFELWTISRLRIEGKEMKILSYSSLGTGIGLQYIVLG
jgi:hypothetical protein